MELTLKSTSNRRNQSPITQADFKCINEKDFLEHRSLCNKYKNLKLDYFLTQKGLFMIRRISCDSKISNNIKKLPILNLL